MNYDDSKELLEKHGQVRVLRFWEKLAAKERESLLLQIAKLDFASIGRMQKMLGAAAAGSVPVKVEPADVIPLSKAKSPEAVRAGEQALKNGLVGVLLVAGGQGSRLGFDGPKGSFPIAPVTNAPLFSIHSRKILGLEKKFNTKIPFYVMTSLANDGATKDFFETNKYFGLAKERVKFFIQGMWPALDKDGKIVLDEPGHIFMSPDGHGGILEALRVNGMLDDMKKNGLETLFYFQVDNPLVEIAEPAFIGLHRMHRVDISVKVCAKRDPDEGLGVVVLRDGRNAVVEYTELTKEQKHARLADGELKFKFGSVAIHVFSLDFLFKEAAAHLPLHVAHKKIACCDDTGKVVKPDKPNGYKFEKFIFDVLPEAARVLNVEFAREEEFSPVKNAEGQDSPETTRRDMVRKYGRWLEACGVAVPKNSNGDPSCKIEIDPCYALGSEDLKKKLGKDLKVTGDVLLK